MEADGPLAGDHQLRPVRAVSTLTAAPLVKTGGAVRRSASVEKKSPKPPEVATAISFDRGRTAVAAIVPTPASVQIR